MIFGPKKCYFSVFVGEIPYARGGGARVYPPGGGVSGGGTPPPLPPTFPRERLSGSRDSPSLRGYEEGGGVETSPGNQTYFKFCLIARACLFRVRWGPWIGVVRWTLYPTLGKVEESFSCVSMRNISL